MSDPFPAGDPKQTGGALPGFPPRPAVSPTVVDGPPARPAPTLDGDPGKPARGKRTWKFWLVVALASLGGLLAIGIGLLAIFWSSVSAFLVERIAAERGITLHEKSASLDWSSARVDGLDATVAKAPGVRLTAKSATADLDWLSPTKLKVKILDIDAADPKAAVSFVRSINTGGISKLPIQIDGVELHLRKLSASVPVGLDIAASQIIQSSDRTRVLGLETQLPFLGTKIGPADFELVKDGDQLTITTNAYPPLTASIDRAEDKVTLQLAETDVAWLGKLLRKDGRPMRTKGKTSMTMLGGEDQSIDGSLDFTLEGYTPPHPEELDGLVFGNDTHLSFDANFARDKITFKNLKADAGALVLHGSGTITLSPKVMIVADLTGAVPCSKVASTLGPKLGLPGGALGGDLAGAALKGNVGVRLHVEVGAPDWKARIEPSAEIGCKLAF